VKSLELPFEKLSLLISSDTTSIDIDRIAQTRASILINGESGTGKEFFARYIHNKSLRAKEPFISINCSGKTETFLENELFGQENVLYFNGVDLVKGKLEQCNGGTLFLDEVGELPIMIQLRLLRVLNEMEFEKVGGTKTIKIDIRFIAASSKDLKSEVESDKFCEELLYRLNVINFTVPVLKKNKKAIPILIDLFINKYAEEHLQKEIAISSDAIEMLMKYDWPGNIFELENIIERAVMLCNENCITKNDLPQNMFSIHLSHLKYIDNILNINDIDTLLELKIPLLDLLENIEKVMVLRALEKSNQTQVRAAEMLGITKSLMQYKMKKYNILSKFELKL
jgi:two-component system, NtrC family, response regulator